MLALGNYQIGGADGFEATKLLSLDPATLRPIGALKLRDAASGFAFSPDRRTLVFAGENFGELLFVDPGRLKVERRLKVVRHPADVSLSIAGWPRGRLLVAFASREGAWWAPHPARLLLVDAESGAVSRHASLGGEVDDVVTMRDGTVVMLRLDPVSGGVETGIPVLVTVGPDGRIRKLPLRRLELDGHERVRVGGTTFRAERTVGLASDGNRRVFAVAADRPIAEVDVPTLHVQYHSVRIPDVRFSVPPMTPGSGGVHLRYSRGANWLGQNLLAFWGTDELPAKGSVMVLHRFDPLRVQIVHTRSWRVVRSVAATSCEPVRAVVLCAGGVKIARSGAGSVDTGLVAYDSRWKVLYRRPAPFYWCASAGRLFAETLSGPRFELDLRTGARLHRVHLPELEYPCELIIWKPARP